jgi:Na+/H+ antiporter NhaD/arsenite permease-like protein
VLSNVPFTIAILPILKGLAIQGIAVGPLWWALALGVGFGGNITPIGAASNVFVVSLSNSMGEPLTFRQWLRSGSLVAVASCAVASAAFFIAFELGIL